MKPFWKKWRKPKNKKPAEEKRSDARKKEPDERQLLIAMAVKSAKIPFFVEACRTRGLEPKKTFLHYYALFQRDPKIEGKEFDERMKAAKEGKRFSRTLFYAKLIATELVKQRNKQ